MSYSPCRSCGNTTFTRYGHCAICGHAKPDEIGPDTPRYFDQRFMTRRHSRWRRIFIWIAMTTAVAVLVLYLSLILRVHS